MGSWQEVKLGDILTESKVESTKPNVDSRIRVLLNAKGVIKRPTKKETKGATKYFIRKQGQFIYGKQNIHKGAFGIVPEELEGFESTSDLPAFDVDKNCLPEWIDYFFKQGGYYFSLVNIARGAATKRVQPRELLELKIPLPSIEVQKEIVEHFKSIEMEDRELKIELTHQQTLLKKLRQQILQEAIKGKLTADWRKQNPDVEPASELLARIQAEKAQLIKENKIRKQKPLPPISEEEKPFELPAGWVWCRMGALFEIVRGSSPRPKGDPRYWSKNRTSFHWITIADFTPHGNNGFLKGTKGYLTEEGSKKSRIVNKGDLLIACSGVGSVGRSIQTDIDGYIYDGLLAIRKINSDYTRALLKLFLKFKEAQIYSVASGANWLNINIEILSNYALALPPLPEQKAIVNKVEKLLALCDQLETQITNNQTHAEQLMQAVLQEAFSQRKDTPERMLKTA